jgi:hypothetical protein
MQMLRPLAKHGSCVAAGPSRPRAHPPAVWTAPAQAHNNPTAALPRRVCTTLEGACIPGGHALEAPSSLHTWVSTNASTWCRQTRHHLSTQCR